MVPPLSRHCLIGGRAPVPHFLSEMLSDLQTYRVRVRRSPDHTHPRNVCAEFSKMNAWCGDAVSWSLTAGRVLSLSYCLYELNNRELRCN